MTDGPGGIFVRLAEQISNEDRILLQTVARVVISDNWGLLAGQDQPPRSCENSSSAPQTDPDPSRRTLHSRGNAPPRPTSTDRVIGQIVDDAELDVRQWADRERHLLGHESLDQVLVLRAAGAVIDAQDPEVDRATSRMYSGGPSSPACATGSNPYGPGPFVDGLRTSTAGGRDSRGVRARHAAIIDP